jgi:THO complex subunit 1
MRRLSKATDLVFSGRILAFLSRIMPLSDPSGVNKKGLYNKTSIVKFDASKSEVKKDVDAMDVDAPSSSLAIGGEETPIDYRFHRQFWSLIQSIQDPSKVQSSNEEWDKFATLMSSMLESFGNISSLEIEDEADGDAYFSKYLTSPKLLYLETQDPHFRRQVLIQILIFLQSLPKASTKPQPPKVELPFPENRKTAVDEWTKKTTLLLEKTPPHGKRFATTVSNFLRREEHWVNWKREGCASFEKHPKLRETQVDPLELAQSTPLGNSHLAEIWSWPDNLEDFNGAKNLHHVIDDAVDELNETDNLESSQLLVHSKLFQLRSIRLIAANKFGAIGRMTNGESLAEVLKRGLDAPAESSASAKTEEDNSGSHKRKAQEEPEKKDDEHRTSKRQRTHVEASERH